MTSLNAPPRTGTAEEPGPVRTRSGVLLPIGLTLAALVLVAVLTLFLHLWWVPFAVGLALGIRRLRLAAMAAGAGGWGVVLLQRQLAGEPVTGAAAVTAALAGLPAAPAVIIVVTLLVALLQGLCGAWLSSAVLALVHRPGHRRQEIG